MEFSLNAINAAISRFKRSTKKLLFNLGCLLAWAIFVVLIGHFPIGIDIVKGASFQTIFPSILLVYVVLIGSNLYTVFDFKNIKACVLLGISILWIFILLTISLLYPFSDRVLAYVAAVGSIQSLATLVSAIGMIVAGFLTFPQFYGQILQRKVKDEYEAADERVRSQGFGMADRSDVEW